MMRHAFLSKRAGDFHVAAQVAACSFGATRRCICRLPPSLLPELRRTGPAFARIHIQRFAPCAGICGKLAAPFRIPRRESKCASRTPSRPQTRRDTSRMVMRYTRVAEHCEKSPIFLYQTVARDYLTCRELKPGWRNGRRTGLKIQRWQHHEGSTSSSGTLTVQMIQPGLFYPSNFILQT